MKKNILIVLLIVFLGYIFTYEIYVSGNFSEINSYLYWIKNGSKNEKVSGLVRLYTQYDLGDKLSDYEQSGDRVSDYARLAALLLIQSLKEETGDDLGDDPKAWIDKYYLKTPEKADTHSEDSK